MFSILLVLLVIVAVMMIGLILLQKSEGSGMSGSCAAALFGNFLTRATAWLATIFFVLCAALALVASKTDMSAQQSALRNEIVMQENTATTETQIDTPATTEPSAE